MLGQWTSNAFPGEGWRRDVGSWGIIGLETCSSEVPQAVFLRAPGNQDLRVFGCFRIYLATYCIVDDNVLMGVA